MLLLVEQEKDTGQLFKVSFSLDCKYRVELSINVFEKEAKDYDIKAGEKVLKVKQMHERCAAG